MTSNMVTLGSYRSEDYAKRVAVFYGAKQHTAKQHLLWVQHYEVGAASWPQSDFTKISTVDTYFHKKRKEWCFSYNHGALTPSPRHFLTCYEREVKKGYAFAQGHFFFQDNRHRHGLHYAILMAYDIDGGLSFEEVVALVTASGYEAFVFTTFSHQRRKGNAPPCDRCRVVFFLNSPFVFPDIEAAHDVNGTAVWKGVYAHVGTLLGFPFDPTCDNPERLFYFHSGPREMRDSARAVHINAGGQKLEINPLVGDVVDEIRKTEHEIRLRKETRRETPPSDDNVEFANACKALNFIDADIDYNGWRNVIFGFHHAFFDTDYEDAALDELIAWSATGRKFEGDESVIQVWESANQGGGITLGSVFHMAFKGGYQKPPSLAELYQRALKVLLAISDNEVFSATFQKIFKHSYVGSLAVEIGNRRALLHPNNFDENKLAIDLTESVL